MKDNVVSYCFIGERDSVWEKEETRCGLTVTTRYAVNTLGEKGPKQWQEIECPGAGGKTIKYYRKDGTLEKMTLVEPRYDRYGNLYFSVRHKTVTP